MIVSSVVAAVGGIDDENQRVGHGRTLTRQDQTRRVVLLDDRGADDHLPWQQRVAGKHRAACLPAGLRQEYTAVADWFGRAGGRGGPTWEPGLGDLDSRADPEGDQYDLGAVGAVAVPALVRGME